MWMLRLTNMCSKTSASCVAPVNVKMWKKHLCENFCVINVKKVPLMWKQVAHTCENDPTNYVKKNLAIFLFY